MTVDTAILPNFPEGERLILGARLIGAAAIPEGLQAVHFYDERHRLILRRIQELEAEKKPVDFVTVIDRLRGYGELEKAGGPEYIMTLTDGLPRAMSVAFYAEEVKERFKLREIIRVSDQALREAWQTGAKSDQLVAAIQRRLPAIASNNGSQPTFTRPDHWLTLDGGLPESWDCAPIRWAAAGLFARGSLVVLAAESQAGKTLLTLHTCRRLLIGGKLYGYFDIDPLNRILFLVLEDPPRRCKSRLIDSAREGEPTIAPGRLDMAFWPGFSLSEEGHFGLLEATIEREHYDMVVLDTFGRATPGILSYDDEKLSIILHRLLAITRKYDVILWINDHLRKAPDKGRAKRELSQADVKGTGAKIQNSDAYYLLSRDGSRLQITGSCKDRDSKVGFLLDVAREGDRSVPKFSYAGDLQQMAGDMAQLGEANRRKVLEMIPAAGTISRAEIVAATGLKDPTVKKHLSALLEVGQIGTNGRKGKAIRYQSATGIGYSQTSLYPNAASDIDTES